MASPTHSQLPPDVPRQAIRLTPQLGQSYWFAFEIRDNYGIPEILQEKLPIYLAFFRESRGTLHFADNGFYRHLAILYR